MPPKLTLIERAPLTVRGIGFAGRELVRVSSAARTVRIRTTATGRFLVSLGSADRCSAVSVTALGARGDRASLHLPLPLCAPASPGSPG